MTIEELKAKVAGLHDALNKKSGGVAQYGPSGPIGVAAIDWLLAVVERQQGEIDAMKARLDKATALLQID